MSPRRRSLSRGSPAIDRNRPGRLGRLPPRCRAVPPRRRLIFREEPMGLTRILTAVAFAAGAAAPAVGQQADLANSHLVGKFQNPTIVTDPGQWPKKFQEAPQLA